MKLWVDDLYKAPEGWHWVRTVTEAIRILGTWDVEEVALDHDICHYETVLIDSQQGEFPFQFACQETFEAVAWFIREKYARGGDYPKKVTIITSNGTGAEVIKAILSPCRGIEVVETQKGDVE